MLSFISFWRASAIVLCDLASTAYYIGGISEQTVSAGLYPVGLINTVLPGVSYHRTLPMNFSAVVLAIGITVYFWWQNIKGVEESSDKALKIMGVTTVMAVIMIAWSLITLAHRGFHWPPLAPVFSDEAWGWLKRYKGTIAPLGVLGITMAFGHTLLAMSGEETLAQVYREMEAPKLENLKRTGFIIFVYSLLLTCLVSFFAVMIIPDNARVSRYSDNLISGLAMFLSGPLWARIAFQGFVVFVGFLILSGAVNTAIVGSNGVLNRLGEDGILPDWLRRPHPRFGTSYRLISLTVGLQILTLILCQGNVLILGEAYAFGVIWSFIFKALAVLVLRFTEPGGREWKVPGNLQEL